MDDVVTAVLVIDPEPTLRVLNAEILADAGYHVEQLPQNADPISFAEQFGPQVIVIGIRPKVLEDRQIVEGLQKNPVTSAIPLVAISTSEDEETSLLALPNVIQTVVAPYGIAALEAAVACAVARVTASVTPRSA